MNARTICATFLTASVMVLSAPAVRAAEAESSASRKRIIPTDGAVNPRTGPYLYDPSGNIAAIGGSSYVYDPMGRVVSAAVDRSGYVQSQTYTYDIYGNRTSDGVTSYAASLSTNRLTTQGAQYDAAGNLTQWQPPGTTTPRMYSYDALSTMMMEKVAVAGGQEYVAHLYTADDERYWSFRGGASGVGISSYSLRDLDGRVLRELSEPAPGDWSARDYIYRDGLLLASHDTRTGDTHHYSLDHLGTPRVVTNGDAEKVAEHTYFPFGAEYTDGSSTDGRLHFTGHEQRDADLLGENRGELDYMHARYYSQSAGRFLSFDPGQADLQGPQSWNRYAYALNSPVVFVDPDGKNVWISGATKEEREAAYAALKASLNDPWAASRLLMVKVGNHYEAKIAGDSNEFKNGSNAAFTLGEAIGMKNVNIKFGFGKVDASNHGAVTQRIEGTRDSTITIDRSAFPQMLDNTYENIATAIHHELGHAIGIATLGEDDLKVRSLLGMNTNEQALHHENMARRSYVRQIELRFGKNSTAARAARSLYKDRLTHGN